MTAVAPNAPTGAAIVPPDRNGKIGTFGCAAAGEGRVVRVARAEGAKGKPPREAEVSCPVCGRTHTVNLSWRSPTRLDEGRKPEIVLTARKE